jgi:hypothetical protein
MKEFKVTFQLESEYENEENNIVRTEVQYIESEDLETLFAEIDGDYIESFDDISVINLDTDDYLIATNIDYVLIEDENKNVVYRDEEFKNK